jgi:hypothetical protein
MLQFQQQKMLPEKHLESLRMQLAEDAAVPNKTEL